MQLLSNIYLVGGRDFYLTKRDNADCNVYAVKTTEGVVLIDCGYDDNSLKTIFENLRYWGMDPAQISHVLLTHSHFDHTGNARTLREQGAKLVAHSTVAEALKSGDERTIHYAFLRGDFPTCDVDIIVGDGDVITVGNYQFTALNVPGHTDGNMVYLTESDGKKIMFAGDFVFHGRPATADGTLAWNGGTEFNSDKFIESLLRIQRIRVDVFLTGHWGFLMANGSAIVDHGLVVALRSWGNRFAEKRLPPA